MGIKPLIAGERQTLSVAIVAKDEEENLRRILPTVAWADEIVLVDSGSTDGTTALAESFGARVLSHTWLGFGAQKNFAIQNCRCDWILSLDADEAVSPELISSIRKVLGAPPTNLVGYFLNRRNLFLGRWMRHGGYYPDAKLRFFKRGRAAFEDRPVHESMIAEGAVSTLRGDLIHNAYPTLTVYLEHMNRYSSASVSLLLARDSRSHGVLRFLWNTVANPVATFLYNYVVRGAFLDGREGLLLHLYHSLYVSMKYAKAWEAARSTRPR